MTKALTRILMLGFLLVGLNASTLAEESVLTVDKIGLGEMEKIAAVSSKASGKTIPVQLVWSPDSKTLYVQSMERMYSDTLGRSATYGAKPTYKFFEVKTDGSDFKEIEGIPMEALRYWDFKATRTSPDGKHEIEDEIKTYTRVRAGATRMTKNYRLFLNKVMIGENEDAPCDPGTTFSWAPPNINGIVYIGAKEDLRLMSQDGTHDDKIAKGKYYLPAWSPDGTMIAAIQGKGKVSWKVYVMKLSGVTPAS